MSEEQLIHHLQCWLFRHAQIKWKKSPYETAELFKKYKLYEFVNDCYGLLHVSSYECALDELEAILNANGVRVYG